MGQQDVNWGAFDHASHVPQVSIATTLITCTHKNEVGIG